MTRFLDELFDQPAWRKLPLQPREQITEALEAMLGRVIQLAAPDLFVEIGAFEASFSRRMRRAFPDATVIAYEANPRVFDRFGAEARAVGVDYRHAALSDRDGSITFNVMEVISGRDMPALNRMGSIKPIAMPDSRSIEVTVRAARLDSELGETAGERACLWVDVEGAAGDVLRGAQRALARTDVLYCEVESGEVWQEQALAPEVIGLAEAAGFVLVARDCQKAFQRNCLFLRPALAARADIAAEVAGYTEAAVQKFRRATEAFVAVGPAA